MLPVFIPLQSDDEPDLSVPVFPTELSNGVQPLARAAAEHLQLRLNRMFPQKRISSSHSSGEEKTVAEGKMFGILVVSKNNQLGYLSAFSGKIEGNWCVDGFVPPPFDVRDANQLLFNGDQQIKRLDRAISSLSHSDQYLTLQDKKQKLILEFTTNTEELIQSHRLRKQQRAEQRQNVITAAGLKQLAEQSQQDKKQRKQLRRSFDAALASINAQLATINQEINALQSQKLNLCRDLQIRYFSLFRLFGADGRTVDLSDRSDELLAASGTGECAAPKLLSFAHQNDYKPLAGAEFWWGSSPPGKIRHHATYYPPCRSKCVALLPRMLSPGAALSGLSKTPDKAITEPITGAPFCHTNDIEIVYEDPDLVVVNKPAGLLSVPGKIDRSSLAEWAASKWPAASGPLLVHRLDMDTSGLVLIALESLVHKQLQKQFMQRQVSKTYVAIVDGWVSLTHTESEGTISLPLRVDLDDRPRQMVCEQHGRFAKTHWRVLNETRTKTDLPITRLQLQPVTGRTHQLRLHMASQHGLGMPISGDPLYAPIVAIDKPRVETDDVCSVGAEPSRMMLHAQALEFIHPASGKSMQVQSAAPF